MRKRKFGKPLSALPALILCLPLALCSCGSSKQATRSASDPYDASEVTSGLYVLTADGLCYAANTDGQTFSGTTTSPDASRVVYSVGGSKFVPTLYADDRLVYFSTDSLPASFTVERFADAGWTVGLYGIKDSLTFTNKSIISGSEISGTLTSSYVTSSDTITITEIGNAEATAGELSAAGTICGLSQGDEVQIGVMKGTFYSSFVATADTRVWYSAETYYANYTATKDGYVAITLPEGLEGSYISVAGTGLMYVSPDDRGADAG